MFFRLRQPSIELESGQVTFVLFGAGDVRTEWNADLVTLKLSIELLERKHDLKSGQDGRLESKQEFLIDLAETVLSLGAPHCTPSQARQIWIAVADQFRAFESRFHSRLRKVLR